MRFPFVLRLRLEMAEREKALLEQQIAKAEEQIADLKAANDKLMELAEMTAEIRLDREQKAEEEAGSSTRPRRMFGTDLMRRATEAASRKARNEGRVK